MNFQNKIEEKSDDHFHKNVLSCNASLKNNKNQKFINLCKMNSFKKVESTILRPINDLFEKGLVF